MTEACWSRSIRNTEASVALLFFRYVAVFALILHALLNGTSSVPAAQDAAMEPAANVRSVQEVIRAVQPKLVKIYGAGGFAGLEPYQSGFFISADGLIVTAWSYVLQADPVTVVTCDGVHLQARLVGMDRRLEVAVLRTDQPAPDWFDLAETASGSPGLRILAFSNLFGIAADREQLSVEHGIIAALSHLDARRGVFPTQYTGPVYVLDVVTNNPGAQGGAVTDYRGRLIGMLGKELRSRKSHFWLNYVIPAAQLREAVDNILTGKTAPSQPRAIAPQTTEGITTEELGIILVPEILENTPPFVDAVRVGSPAQKAGLQPDDLILMINDQLVASCKDVKQRLQELPANESVKITVLRDEKVVEITTPLP